MQWYTLTMIFVAAALGAPAPTRFTVAPALRDQGDGFYLATFDDAGAANIQFTPLTENSKIVAAPASKYLADTDTIGKRSDTSCQGHSFNATALDWANNELAEKSNSKWYNKGEWGWVHNNTETSYFCSYQRQFLSKALIMDMHRTISDTCGGNSAYGFTRRVNSGGANDLSVGRTFRSDNFCDNDYHDRK